MSFWVVELLSWWAIELISFWVDKLLSWWVFELGSFWVDEFLGWWVCEFVSWCLRELLGFREFISLHSSQFIEILKVKTTSTFITKYFAIPPFFHTFATAKRAYQALQHRFRSSVGLEQQPSKLWVLGSNPNGITKGECKGIPLYYWISPTYEVTTAYTTHCAFTIM